MLAIADEMTHDSAISNQEHAKYALAVGMFLKNACLNAENLHSCVWGLEASVSAPMVLAQGKNHIIIIDQNLLNQAIAELLPLHTLGVPALDKHQRLITILQLHLCDIISKLSMGSVTLIVDTIFKIKMAVKKYALRTGAPLLHTIDLNSMTANDINPKLVAFLDEFKTLMGNAAVSVALILKESNAFKVAIVDNINKYKKDVISKELILGIINELFAVFNAANITKEIAFRVPSKDSESKGDEDPSTAAQLNTIKQVMLKLQTDMTSLRAGASGGNMSMEEIHKVLRKYGLEPDNYKKYEVTIEGRKFVTNESKIKGNHGLIERSLIEHTKTISDLLSSPLGREISTSEAMKSIAETSALSLLRAKSNGETLLKLAEAKVVHSQYVHSIIDGYGNAFHIIKYVFAMNWISVFKFATTIEKALKGAMEKKITWLVFWNKLHTRTLELLLRDPLKVTKHASTIAVIMRNLTAMNEFMKSQIAPMINDAEIDKDNFYLKLALAYHVNEKRIDESKNVILWNSVDFLHDWKRLCDDGNEKAMILGSLSLETGATFAGIYNKKEQKTGVETKSDAIKVEKVDRKGRRLSCFNCNGNHFQRVCPKKPKIFTPYGRGRGRGRGWGRGRGGGYHQRQRRNYDEFDYGQQWQSNYGAFDNNNNNFYNHNQPPQKRFRSGDYDSFQQSGSQPQARPRQAPPNQGARAPISDHKYELYNGHYYVRHQERGGPLCDYWGRRKRGGCKFAHNFRLCRWLHCCGTCWLANEHRTEECPNARQNRAF